MAPAPEFIVLLLSPVFLSIRCSSGTRSAGFVFSEPPALGLCCGGAVSIPITGKLS